MPVRLILETAVDDAEENQRLVGIQHFRTAVFTHLELLRRRRNLPQRPANARFPLFCTPTNCGFLVDIECTPRSFPPNSCSCSDGWCGLA